MNPDIAYRHMPVCALLLMVASTTLVRAIPGGVDPLFDPNVGGGIVRATAIQPDGKILIAGRFTSVGGVERRNIARLNADGSVESAATFNPGTGVNNTVHAVAVQRDGKIVIGGIFTRVNGQLRQGVARLNPDGSVESTATFTTGLGFTLGDISGGTVNSVAVQPDGKILVGGLFTKVDGQSRSRIARLNPNGSVESTATFDPGTGLPPDSEIRSMALQEDGKILIAGSFSAVNSLNRRNIARILPNGNVESTATFDTGSGPDSDIYAVAVQPDGKILIGGLFTNVNGEPRARIARLNPNGSLESTAGFNPGAGADQLVDTLALQADGKIILGGNITAIDGQMRNGVARLLADGTLESTAAFDFSPGVTGVFLSNATGVALRPDGAILLSGGFTTVSDVPRNRLALLTNAPATSLVVPRRTRIEWRRSGAAPEIGRVTFDLSTNNGQSWSGLGSGTKIAAGRALAGLTLPDTGTIRARGYTSGGFLNGSTGLLETVQPFRITPEIAVHDGNAGAPELSDGHAMPVSLGRNVQGTPGTHLFTIANTGTADLRVSAVTVPAGYALQNLPALPFTVAPDQSATFQVNLTTLTVGTNTGSVVIASDDLDEAIFDFPLTGDVFIPDPVSAVVSTTTVLNRQTGLREQTIHITNDTTATVPAYNLIIRGLPAGVEVNNASETRADGSVLVYIRQMMLPHSTQDIVLEYYSANRAPVVINPQLSTEVVLNPPDLTVQGTDPGLTIDRITRLPGGAMMIEFASTPGRRYQVQYSPDGTAWQNSLPPICAAANRTQWTDRGLPRTDSSPATHGSRMYRVTLIP